MKFSVFIFLLILNSNSSFSQSGWFWQNPLPQGNNLFDLQIIDSSIAYSSGDFGTIIKTTNQGNQWSIISSEAGYTCNSLFFNNFSTGYVVSIKIESFMIVNIWLSKILKTTNGGHSWTNSILLHNTKINNIEFCGLDTGYLFGEENFSDLSSDGVIYKTTNGGANWTEQNSGLHIYESFFLNSLTGYACGNGIFMTTNGGSNWTEQNSGINTEATSITFINSNVGFAVGRRWQFPPNPSLPRIWKTTNGGKEWSSSSVDNIGFQKIEFINENTGLISAPGYLYKTTNGGGIWFNITPANLKSNSIDLTVSGTGYSVGGTGLILRTQNYGDDWVDLTPSHRNGGSVVLKFWDKNIGYAADYKSIYKTTNGGQNWLIQVKETELPLLDLTVTDSNNVYVAGGNTENKSIIMKTTNGGEEWLNLNPSFGKPITSISFVNNNTGYFSGYGYIMKTTNGGKEFFYCTKLYPEYIFKIYFINKDIGYAGGADHVYKTIDGGVTWLTVSNQALTTSVYFLNTDTGFSAGYNCQIKKTTNGGISWATKYNESSGRRILDVHFLNDNNGFAVGEFGTILKTTNGGESWVRQLAPTDVGLRSVSMVANDISYIGGLGSVILCTTSGGNPVGIGQELDQIPTQFSISQNYPNPFNPDTKIDYELPTDGNVRIIILDMLGREIKKLVNNEFKAAGRYTIEFNGNNLSSGIYFYRIDVTSNKFTEKLTESKRMVLIK